MRWALRSLYRSRNRGDDQAYSTAVSAMVASMLFFVSNDTFNKLARDAGLPTSELLALRGIMSTILILALLMMVRQMSRLSGLKRPTLILRSLMEAPIALGFIWSVQYLDLAEITAILLLAPFMIAALGAIFLKQRVGVRRLSAIFLGFIGFLLIEKPWEGGGTLGFGLPTFVALGCALSVAIRELITSRMDVSYSPMIAALGSVLVSTVAGFVISPFETWIVLDNKLIFYLVGSALFLVLGNYFIFIGARVKEASSTTPFRFTSILWAITFGYFFLGELPDLSGFLGMTIILAANLYVFFRERQLRRKGLLV